MKKTFLVLTIVGIALSYTPFQTQASSKNSRIVAQQDFLAHSGSLSTTTIYTPSTEGDFRISMYASGSSSLSGSTSAILWTDNRSSRSFAPSIADSFVSLTEVIHSTASQPIQVALLTSNTDYDVFITIEEM
jgi:hypothetical protein